MKYSVSAYSFGQYLSAGRLTAIECVGKAKELGFDAIEFTDGSFSGTDDKKAFAKELRNEADRVGIEISNLAVGADLLAGDSEIEKLKEWLDIANILGCPTMRHDVTGGVNNGRFKSYDSVLYILAERCLRVTEYAKTLGIKTMTENHGYFSQDSDRVEKLINAVNNDNFGQLVDIGNFLCADEDPVKAVGRCAPYAFYVHAKDFIVKSGNKSDPGEGFFMTRGGNFLRGTIVGHGDVPVLACLRALRRVGYDGYIAIEFEGMEDCVKGIKIGLNNLKRFVALA